VWKQLRRSLALKLILASAIPSAVALVAGLWALIAHTRRIAAVDPARAFGELRDGAVLGTLLALTFAGIAIALAARHFLIKPIQSLKRVMARAELGEFLVRARVQSEDELGQLARSFNTMLSRITDQAVHDIETHEQLQLQEELQAVNARLAGHVGEMELLLEVAKAISSTLDLPEQLDVLGKQMCARFGVVEFSVMLLDEASHQLIIEAIAGDAEPSVRGMRFHLGEGIAGEAAARGETIYVPDVEREKRFVQQKGQRRISGSLLSVPLRSKGRILGVMNAIRSHRNAFSDQEIRLAEAIAAQAALSIANARLYQQTLELSFTDSLTGVPNRRHLFLRLEQEHSRSVRFGEPLSLLMVDLDNFKNVNDRHGHLVGDGVLRGVALTLRRNVRKIDLVARYGGEEFVVLLPRVAKPEAIEVAEKLRRTVAATVLPGPGNAPVTLTISVGVAALGPDAEDIPGLLEKADAALYEAKRQGRDRVATAAPAARASA